MTSENAEQGRPRPRSSRRHTAAGATAGLAAACAGLATAQLTAAWVRPDAAPVTAVGGAVVDRTPVGLREWAVARFGTADKLVLTLGIIAVLVLLAAAAGILAGRRLPAGMAVVGAVGLLGALAAVSRPQATWRDALPSAVGTLTTAAVLYLLVRALRTPRPGGAPPGGAWALDRRGFVRLVAATLAAAAGTGYAGRRLGAHGSAGATASRTGFALPPPDVPAPP
ncbi:molybdopterin-binding oxidoreductase, partial [Streptomyces sp. BR123]|nr:molybdopterin-binding oxidoreductase [Streptomyces sp. BR123]